MPGSTTKGGTEMGLEINRPLGSLIWMAPLVELNSTDVEVSVGPNNRCSWSLVNTNSPSAFPMKLEKRNKNRLKTNANWLFARKDLLKDFINLLIY